MAAKFYRIESRPLTKWGDYGDILQHGMSTKRTEGLIDLERTGPFIPPITFPWWDILLTSAARDLLEGSGLREFTFQPVHSTQIVKLDWHEWDLTAAKPKAYPAGGEPESYILGRKHNPAVAQEMGQIWELLVPQSAKVEEAPFDADAWMRGQRQRKTWLMRDSWNGEDVFRGVGCSAVLVTERANNWLAEHWGQYVDSYEISCK